MYDRDNGAGLKLILIAQTELSGVHHLRHSAGKHRVAGRPHRNTNHYRKSAGEESSLTGFRHIPGMADTISCDASLMVDR